VDERTARGGACLLLQNTRHRPAAGTPLRYRGLGGAGRPYAHLLQLDVVRRTAALRRLRDSRPDRLVRSLSAPGRNGVEL